jgi:hypothetical protein
MTPPSSDHRIYLLSVWREEKGDAPSSPTLRFRLQDPRTGESHGFDGVDALIAYLRAHLTASVDDNGPP